MTGGSTAGKYRLIGTYKSLQNTQRQTDARGSQSFPYTKDRTLNKHTRV